MIQVGYFFFFLSYFLIVMNSYCSTYAYMPTEAKIKDEHLYF